MSEPVKLAAAGVEYTLAIIGLILLWQHVLSAKARAERGPALLQSWDAAPRDFVFFILYVIAGMFGGGFIADLVARPFGLVGDVRTVTIGAGAQLGMLAGVIVSAVNYPSFRGGTATGNANVVATGATTFLIALPFLVVVSKAWELFLLYVGLPVERQDLIQMFARTHSPWLTGFIILFAVVFAPFTEELVFRAGVFRYLRTRLARPLALILQAVLFAVLHANFVSFLPLVLLAIIFALAYERTGKIGTSMVAHALFNLNSVLLLLAGAE